MRKLTAEASFSCPCFFWGVIKMENIKLYEVNADYIDYLSAYAPHMFQNKKAGQKKSVSI